MVKKKGENSRSQLVERGSGAAPADRAGGLLLTRALLATFATPTRTPGRRYQSGARLRPVRSNTPFPSTLLPTTPSPRATFSSSSSSSRKHPACVFYGPGQLHSLTVRLSSTLMHVVRLQMDTYLFQTQSVSDEHRLTVPRH